MDMVNVNFSEWIQKGLELYKANLATLLLVSLLAIVLSGLTVGILGGPMLAGMIMVTLALLDKKEPKPEVGDVFKGFNYFLQSFLLIIVLFAVGFVGEIILSLIPLIGPVLSMLYNFALQTFVMFALFHIVDRNMEFVPAAKASADTVKTNFWPFLGLQVVASVLSSLGVFACCIGIFLTAPLYTCILAVAYREIYGAPAVAAPVAPAAPPA